MKLKSYLTFFMFITLSVVYSQTKKIVTGTVKDLDGLTLPGASILIAGTDQGVMTDDQGLFTINVAEGDVLNVSYVFCKTQAITITASSHYDIVLSQESKVLDDLIVVAYGTSTKESVTGSISLVTSSDIEKRPNLNVLNSLEGTTSGIRVTNSSGQPGSEPTVRIRGFTSLINNEPLIVLDGDVYSGRVGDINPTDVENITVLKDASATTLYGNRASNGVILINTKKASKGQGFLGVSFKQGLFSRSLREYDKVGPNEYMETMWKGYRNSIMNNQADINEASRLATLNLIPEVLGLNIYNLPHDQLFDANGRLKSNASILPGYRSDLDWYKPVERIGTYQDLNLNARVSNDKGGAYFSTGFLNNEGYFRGIDYKRFTTRINADYILNDAIKVGTNVSGSHQITNSLTEDPASFASSIAPIYPIHLHNLDTGEFLYDELGNKIYDIGEDTRRQYQNRHMILENQLNSDEYISTSLNTQLYADIKFLKDFTFSLKGNLALRYSDTRKYENGQLGTAQSVNGKSSRSSIRGKTYSFQQLLNWKRDFGNHNVEVLAGHENYNSDNGTISGDKVNEIFSGIVDWSNFNTLNRANDFITKYRTEGYFSRAKYNYANKYFLEASFRRDGSSKFHEDSRWGNFWSIGGSWTVSAEEFFKVKQIDYLKVKASYGEVGDDGAAGLYAYHTLYRLVSNGGKPGAYRRQFGNRGLKWETSSSINFGVDARVFDRVNFTFEYFDKRSQNLLLDLQLPISSGSTAPTSSESSIISNVGSISNYGVEFTFDVDIVRTDDWKWNVGANATMLKNKLLKLPAENREHGIVSPPYLRKEGRSVYEFWLPEFIGVDQMTGQSLYSIDTEKYNVNGSAPGKPSVSEDYLVEINGKQYTTNPYAFGKSVYGGSAIPKIDGSFFTTLSYKNFSLSGLFTYALGGKVLDLNYMGLMDASDMVNALHKDIVYSWDGIPQGMTATSPDRIKANGIPQVNYETSVFNNAESTRFIKNGNFFSVKNIMLNYQFPKSLLSKINVKQLNMNVSIENVYTFTKLKGLDPQQSFSGAVGSGAGAPRIFIFGINMSF